MLAPHHAEDAEFGEVGVAAQNFLRARVFVGGKTVLGRDLRRDFNFGVNHRHAG